MPRPPGYLRPNQLAALRALAQRGPSTDADLASDGGIHRGAVGTVMWSLRDRRLVELEGTGPQRRWKLTAEGAAAIKDQ